MPLRPLIASKLAPYSAPQIFPRLEDRFGPMQTLP